MLFETARPVEHYLRLIDDKASRRGQPLYLTGYLEGFNRQDITDGLVYEDVFQFACRRASATLTA